jgi:hypothetical protein
VIDEGTDLTSLVGENGLFKSLVENLFQTEYGSVKWGHARHLSKGEFLSNFSSHSTGVRSMLIAWARYYSLEDKFRQDNNSSEFTPTSQQAPIFSVDSPAYSVLAVVQGAINSSGARGNVYKMLERFGAVYDPSDGIQVKYKDDDLNIQALFLTWEQAIGFRNALNEWEIHKELVNLSGVIIDPKTPVEVVRPRNFSCIMLQDYQPTESESPCQSLNDLHSYRLSVPVTEQVEPNSALTKYQSVDKNYSFLRQFKCHLKDKARFKSLQGNENNILAASWPFHQMMDGLNTESGLPLVCISVLSRGSSPSAAHDDRVSITLRLEFSDEIVAAAYVGNERLSTRINDKIWDVVVYVADPELFTECVTWKENDARQKWEEHQRFLDAI